MRPTNLNFRNPRESTPEPYDVRVTSNGVSLMSSKKRMKGNFSTSDRFKEIKSDKTSFWRGPGSYDLTYMNIGKSRPGKVHIYRPYYLPVVKDSDYIYYGDSLVCKKQPFPKKQSERKIEIVIQRSRSTTASTRFRSVVRTVKSPSLYQESLKSSRSCRRFIQM